MKNQRSCCLALVTMVCVLVTSCASGPQWSATPQYQVKGKVKDGIYYSPDQNFSCPLPQFVGPGTVVKDRSDRVQGGIMGTVGFDDMDGSLYRIEWIEIMPESRTPLREMEMHRTLLEAVRAHELHLFRSFSRNVRIEHEETSGEGNDSKKFFVLFAAQAANIGEGRKRADSTRGFLIFVKGNWVYALSIQDTAPFRGQTELADIRNNRLKAELEKFSDTVSFK